MLYEVPEPRNLELTRTDHDRGDAERDETIITVEPERSPDAPWASFCFEFRPDHEGMKATCTMAGIGLERRANSSETAIDELGVSINGDLLRFFCQGYSMATAELGSKGYEITEEFALEVL